MFASIALMRMREPLALQFIRPDRESCRSAYPSAMAFANLAGKENKRKERAVRNCITGEVLFNTTELNETFAVDIEDVVFKSQKTVTELANERQASFQKIYKTYGWGSSQPSGPGSALRFAQEEMAILHSVIRDLKFRLKKTKISLLDIPCGDMTWMPRFLDTRDDVDYTGMDIVPEIINTHKKKFSKKPWKFVHQDIVASALDKPYDLIHTRQMLQHLTNRDVLTALRHFSASGSGFLLATTFATYPLVHELEPHQPARYRTLNLELPPFSLTRPLCYSRDGPPGSYKYLHFSGLWELPLSSIRKCGEKFRVKKVTLHGVAEDMYSCD